MKLSIGYICLSYAVFLSQFEVNLLEWVFQKGENCTFQLKEKRTSVNAFQIEQDKSYDYLIMI